MEITVSDFGELGKLVTLIGRLDILGAEKIDLPLAVVAGSRTNIVVDLDGVDFIASIGIRHLVLAAKTVARNSRTLVLLNPKPLVSDVLTTAGLQTILPIVRSKQEAEAVLSRYRRLRIGAPAGSLHAAMGFGGQKSQPIRSKNISRCCMTPRHGRGGGSRTRRSPSKRMRRIWSPPSRPGSEAASTRVTSVVPSKL